MRREVPLDYLEEVYLFHCVTQSFDCKWFQSRVDGWITCYHPADMFSCTFPMPNPPRRLIYVGFKRDGLFEVFRPFAPPTRETHGRIYSNVIGPFRTLQAARLMAECKGIINVDEAERISKRKEPVPWKRL